MDGVYIAIMLAAIAVGVVFSRFTQSGIPLQPRQRAAIAMGAFIGSMIAAKLPYFFMASEGMLNTNALFENGKTITFGLVGGYFGVELAKLLTGVTTKTGDSFAAPVAAAIAVGRLACFRAGCCYGTATTLPWACKFGDGIPRHPTQIYEVAFHTVAAILLFVLFRRGMLRGQLIKLYFISYFAYRFFTEFIRPEPRLFWHLTLYQWASVAFIPLFVALWIRDDRLISKRSA